MSKVQIRPTAKTTATTITNTNVRSTGVLVELVDLSISKVVSFSSKNINQIHCINMVPFLAAV